MINLITDGTPGVRNQNATSDLDKSGSKDARDNLIAVIDNAVTEGLDEFDVEGANMPSASQEWFKNWTLKPQPGIVAPPFTKPGWIRNVQNMTEFTNTINEKFQAIIPEYPTLMIALTVIAVTTVTATICKRVNRKETLKTYCAPLKKKKE